VIEGGEEGGKNVREGEWVNGGMREEEKIGGRAEWEAKVRSSKGEEGWGERGCRGWGGRSGGRGW